jgi:hypothetical protein
VIYCQNAGLKVTNCIFRGTQGGSDLATSEAGSAKYEVRGCWFSGAKPLDSIVSVDSDNFTDSTTALHFVSSCDTANCPVGSHPNRNFKPEEMSSAARPISESEVDVLSQVSSPNANQVQSEAAVGQTFRPRPKAAEDLVFAEFKAEPDAIPFCDSRQELLVLLDHHPDDTHGLRLLGLA